MTTTPRDRASARHYTWAEVCDGWHLVERDDLSVILERMPRQTREEQHLHTRARQFFYVLSGQAVLLLEDHEVHLSPGQGLEVAPGTAHQMRNDSDADLEFLVVSAPKAHGDRAPVRP